MFCKNCGKEIKKSHKFCAICGNKIKGDIKKPLINILIKINGNNAIKLVSQNEPEEKERWDYVAGLEGSEITYLFPPKFKQYLLSVSDLHSSEITESNVDSIIDKRKDQLEHIFLLFLLLIKDFLLVSVNPEIVTEGLLKIQEEIHEVNEKLNS